jgi:TolB-like protein
MAKKKIDPLNKKNYGPTGPLQTVNSIAVLPLVNTTGDPNLEYLSDGITEGVIHSLSQFRKLRVMARTTVFHFKGHDIDPRRVGRDLKVESVLTGTLAKHGETLRIEAELVNVGNGSEIWGEHYNRSASSISAVESDIAHDIANGLRLDIAADSSVGQIKQSTTSAEAYQLYLKGRYEWNKRSEVGLKRRSNILNRQSRPTQPIPLLTQVSPTATRCEALGSFCHTSRGVSES